MHFELVVVDTEKTVRIAFAAVYPRQAHGYRFTGREAVLTLNLHSWVAPSHATTYREMIMPILRIVTAVVPALGPDPRRRCPPAAGLQFPLPP